MMTTTIQPTKTCPKCGDTKPLTEFHKDKSKKDGRQPCCKPCKREKVRRWKKANAAQVRAKARENNRRWREANPEKVRECDRKQNRKRSAEISAYVKRAVPLIRHFEGRHDTLGRLGKILAKDKALFHQACRINDDLETLNVHYVAKEEPYV